MNSGLRGSLYCKDTKNSKQSTSSLNSLFMTDTHSCQNLYWMIVWHAYYWYSEQYAILKISL